MSGFRFAGRCVRRRSWAAAMIAGAALACSTENEPPTPPANLLEAGTAAEAAPPSVDASGFAAPVPVSVDEAEDAGGEVNANELQEPSAEYPIGYCAEAKAVGEGWLVDDFEDGDLRTLRIDNRAGRWFTYDDATPGGVLNVQVEPSGAGSMALHVASRGWAEWGSGVGVTMRFTVTGEEVCYYDASHYEGIRFRARGSGAPRLAVAEPSTTPLEGGGRCTPAVSCNDYHGVYLSLTNEWVEYRVPFTELNQVGWGTAVGPADPSQLFAIHFQMGASRDSDIWIDDVGFFRSEEELEDAGALLDAGARGDGGLRSEMDSGVAPQPDASSNGGTGLDGSAPPHAADAEGWADADGGS